MKFVIFDLDGTAICSKHRQATLPCGNLDLAHWRENCTPEKIAQDKLLPLAQSMLAHIANNDSYVIVCTARIMTDADFDYLSAHGLHADYILSRPIDCDIADAQLKIVQLTRFFKDVFKLTLHEANAIMFDDNQSVISAMLENGIKCYDARAFNYGK